MPSKCLQFSFFSPQIKTLSLVSRKEIQIEICVSRRKFLFGGVEFCLALPSRPCWAPIPASRLYFFRISKAFSFLISFASSPISLQYSLNFSSESWFTSKLFIFSSREPTSYKDIKGLETRALEAERVGRTIRCFSQTSMPAQG